MTDPGHWWRPRWRGARDRFGLLVLLLVAVLLLSGVSDDAWVRFAAVVLNICALVVGLGSTGSHRRLWGMAALIVAGLVGAFLVAGPRVDGLGVALGASVQVVLLSTLTVAVFARLLRHERVTRQTLYGAIAGFLLLGQVFAWVYMGLPGYLDQAVLEPVEIGEIPIYYSYVVLTTLGFGDIQPVGALAQRITVVEALIGQLYLATVISRLVSLSSREAAPSAW